MPELAIKYRDSPYGAEKATTPAADDIQTFSDLESMLADSNIAPQYATFEDGYWTLGTAFRLFPDSPNGLRWGLFSKQMSDADGVFARPIVLTLELSALYSAVDFSLEFDSYGPTWCSDLSIQWYRDDTLLFAQDYQPDSWCYVCSAEVRNFNKMIITFRRMSVGYRFLKLQALAYGTTVWFYSEALRSVDMYQETDLISNTVAINTLDFDLYNANNIKLIFQRRQLLNVMSGTELLGSYYISTSSKGGKKRYSIHAVDLVGLADMAADHQGGIYDGVRADVLAAEILGPEIPLEMDASLQDVLLYGYLPKASRRENLRQLAFALGAMVRTSRRSAIQIAPASSLLFSEIGNARTYENGSVSSNAPVTEVRIVAYSYTIGQDASTLYEDTLSGDELLEFSEPVSSLQIAGGQIVESGANYALIRGTGAAVLLTGKPYVRTQRVYAKQNPLRNANDADNVVSYENMTLVNPQNAQSVLDACYAYNMRPDTIDAKVLVTTEQPGDYVSMHTEQGVKTGHLISMDYTFSSKLAADVVIVADPEGGDPE